MKLAWCFLICALAPLGCAHLHRVSYDEADLSRGGTPVEVTISESGLNTRQAAAVGKAISPSNSKQIGKVQSIVALFQWGPSTGNPVLSDTYADAVAIDLLSQCPSGNLTALQVRRETNSYPVISGEIIKVKGVCLP